MSKSPHQEREDHFKGEKEILAEEFGDFLLERLKSIDFQKVILFIDAGTTLKHFLLYFGKKAKEIKKDLESSADWIDNIIVVTNNFSGFNELLKEGIYPEDPEHLASEMALRCILLPGRILPAYKAIVGFEQRYLGQMAGIVLGNLKPYKAIKDIRNAVDDFHDKEKEGIRIISLVTGNWVRIRNTSPRYPVPLARGAGHLNIKREMIYVADEVYVISPLGKIFVDKKKDEVNKLLSIIAVDNNPYKHSYKEINTLGEPFINNVHSYEKKIKLVSTTRIRKEIFDDIKKGKIDSRYIEDNLFRLLLSGNSIKVAESFGEEVSIVNEKVKEDEKYKFSTEDISNVNHLLFEYNPARIYNSENINDKLIKLQLKIEFPHSYAKNKAFWTAFHVSGKILDKLAYLTIELNKNEEDEKEKLRKLEEGVEKVKELTDKKNIEISELEVLIKELDNKLLEWRKKSVFVIIYERFSRKFQKILNDLRIKLKRKN